MKTTKFSTIEIKGNISSTGFEEILSEEALDFLGQLHKKFNAKRLALLEERKNYQEKLDSGFKPGFPEETQAIRSGNWQAAELPEALQNRKVEITGPVDRKMIINALNSGAKVFMADFEDASSPTWENMIQGQINLRDAINGTIDFTAENGKTYQLSDQPALLKVRPRGWHLTEKNLSMEGQPLSGSLVDFGLFFFHNAKTLLEQERGPFFYLPKLETYEEARLWNEVFIEAQNLLGIPQGSIKATVLIETITAALQMEEIIYELRDHMAGLNAGRWDYIFSVIKKFKNHADSILPDRAQVGMTVPFMRSYAIQLVKACHKRNVHAMGGMAAFIPSKDEKVNQQAFEKVKADKKLEAETGFDGTWVAHPGLIPTAMEQFDLCIGAENANQKHKKLAEVKEDAASLLKFNIPGGKITTAGMAQNINVAILYLYHWLNGRGAVALYNLMEDAATAEISRAQLWQLLHQPSAITTEEGDTVNKELFDRLLDEELEKIQKIIGDEAYRSEEMHQAVKLLEELVMNEEFEEFLTLPAYKLIN
ncbi:MAG: malate synthase A [Cyclobacteriaceae bacterium]|nr:malate synthase A [Cyclobacteriaceae bacterium]MCH8516065.1 malate synthase A [Cyclobacteriaceae bacterium]